VSTPPPPKRSLVVFARRVHFSNGLIATVRYFHRELKTGRPPALISSSFRDHQDCIPIRFLRELQHQTVAFALAGPIKGVDKNGLIYL
jgi:hypothetical protein